MFIIHSRSFFIPPNEEPKFMSFVNFFANGYMQRIRLNPVMRTMIIDPRVSIDHSLCIASVTT